MYSSANVESKLLQLCWVRFFILIFHFFVAIFFLTINQILLVFHTLFWKRWFYILFIRAFNLWWYETTLLFYESVKVKYFNQVGIVLTAFIVLNIVDVWANSLIYCSLAQSQNSYDNEKSVKIKFDSKKVLYTCLYMYNKTKKFNIILNKMLLLILIYDKKN